MEKYRQNRHSRRIRWIRQNRRFVGAPISSSIALWRNFVKIAILIEFAGLAKIGASSVPLSSSIALCRNIAKIAILAGFAKIVASSVPLSRAQSLFGKILPKSPFSPNSPDSPKSPLRRYPYLELSRFLAKYRQNCHSRRIRQIRQNRRSSVPLSRAQSLFHEISRKSPNSTKSPLRRYPYLELNRSLVKFRQNRHSRRIRRIRENRRFISTPISSSIALW